MRYADAGSFRQALEQRLKDSHGRDPGPLTRERKRIAFERLLARLAAAAPERWVLKGGFALDLRMADQARFTKDIDLAWSADEDDLLEALSDAAREDAGDWFEFVVRRAPAPPDRLGGSHRFAVSCSLAGRQFESFVLDVGVQEHRPAVERIESPDRLGFAGLEPVSFDVIALAPQIAEKLHAYVRIYPGDRPTTRTKDLVDFVLIAELFTLDARQLGSAIAETFSQRDTVQPTKLPPPPADWAAPYRTLALEVGIPEDLDVGFARAQALLDPVLGGRTTDSRWDPNEQQWLPAEGQR